MKSPLRLTGLLILVIIMAACTGPADSDMAAPTPIPTYAPYVAPTATLTRALPTETPITAAATEAPTPAPTPTSTEVPAEAPTALPSEAPTAIPTEVPTVIPTQAPTIAPTEAPTAVPTIKPTATATATPLPTATPKAVSDATTLAELTPPQITADLPADFASLLATADAVRGQALTVSNGCTACHSLEKDVRLVGPSWFNLGDHAVTRVPGESPALYLYTSILYPNEYLNETYPANIMPMIYADTLPQADLADIVAYFLSLSGE